MAVEIEMATILASSSPATHSARALSMPASTLAGSCTCQPACGCSSRYSRSAVGMSAGAPLTPKAATLTAVVPTSTPIMTSVVPLFMSLGLDGGGLMENSVDEVLVPAEPGLENV